MNLRRLKSLACLIILATILGPGVSLAAGGCQAHCCHLPSPGLVSPAWTLETQPCSSPARADEACRVQSGPGLARTLGPNLQGYHPRYPVGPPWAGYSWPVRAGLPGRPALQARGPVSPPAAPAYLTLMSLLC